MDDLIRIIKEQTQTLYLNTDAILDALNESDLYDKNICDWPLGDQIYHMLHSMNYWFINPSLYPEPDYSPTDKGTKKILTKNEIIEYCKSVKDKITKYLENLNSDSLAERPPNCQFSKLALILGQFRHFMYHVGLIHGCLRIHTKGTSPQYFGLDSPIKPLS